jgi:hypothetical protein
MDVGRTGSAEKSVESLTVLATTSGGALVTMFEHAAEALTAAALLLSCAAELTGNVFKVTWMIRHPRRRLPMLLQDTNS